MATKKIGKLSRKHFSSSYIHWSQLEFMALNVPLREIAQRNKLYYLYIEQAKELKIIFRDLVYMIFCKGIFSIKYFNAIIINIQHFLTTKKKFIHLGTWWKYLLKFTVTLVDTIVQKASFCWQVLIFLLLCEEGIISQWAECL